MNIKKRPAKSSPGAAEVAGAEEPLSIFKAPWLVAYQYIGQQIQKTLPYFEDLRGSMQKAAIKISLQSYVSMLLLFTGLSALLSSIVTGSIAAFAGAPIWLLLIYALGIGILFGVLVFVMLYSLPAFLAISRRKRMDLELPYVASHMSILAAAGIPPTRMFRLLEDSVTTPEVASDANEIVRDVDVLGNDIMTALELERERSPSEVFADVLEGLVATIRSGGNMMNYLLDAANTIMDLRRIAAKRLIESLATFAEIYVTLLVVLPLLLIVMFSVMALVGGGLGGVSVVMMMAFVTYLVIPICGAGVAVMLDSMLVEE